MFNALDAQPDAATFTYSQTGDRLSKQGQGLAVGDYRYHDGTHCLTAAGNAERAVDRIGHTSPSPDQRHHVTPSAYGFASLTGILMLHTSIFPAGTR